MGRKGRHSMKRFLTRAGRQEREKWEGENRTVICTWVGGRRKREGGEYHLYYHYKKGEKKKRKKKKVLSPT